MRHRVIAITLAMVLLVALVAGLAGCSVVTSTLKGIFGGGSSYGIGDEIPAGPLTASLLEVRFAPRIDGFFPELGVPEEGFAFVIAKIELTNTSDAPAAPPSVLEAGMYLQDGQGLPLAGPVLSNGPYDFHDLLDIGELAAGETTTTYVVFVGPEGQTLDRLAFRNWIEGDSEELSIDLGGAVIEVTEPEPIAIGEPFEVNGLRVTVHGVKYPASYSYKSGIMSGTYTPEEGGVYAQLDLTIENVSNPEPHDFSVTNVLGTLGISTGPGASARILADDVIYSADDLLGLFKEDAYPKPQWWKVKPLAIGESERAFAVFIVPDDATELLFEYREPTLGPTPQVKLK